VEKSFANQSTLLEDDYGLLATQLASVAAVAAAKI